MTATRTTSSTASLSKRLEADPGFRGDWERLALARAVAIQVTTYRIEHGLSQTGLGRKLGMHQPAIARLEAGDHNPSVETLMRLSRGLGIDLHIDITPDNVAVKLTA